MKTNFDSTKTGCPDGIFTATEPSSDSLLTSVPRPEFLRLPQPGLRCPWTGMTRSALNALILPTADNDFKPPVRSFVLRRRGARTGIRLIDAAKLFSYIRSHEDCGRIVEGKL